MSERVVPVRDGAIRLGQFLKLVGAVDSGAEAKDLLASGAVSVNDAPEDRRGRQLATGDRVTVGAEAYRVGT